MKARWLWPAVSMVSLGLAILATVRPLRAQYWPPREVIEANEFVLRDPLLGGVRARLYADFDQWGMIVYDRNGKPAVTLKAGNSGGGEVTVRTNGRVQIGMVTQPEAKIVISDSDGTERTSLGENSPGMVVRDGRGRVVWAAGLDPLSKEVQQAIRGAVR